MQRLGKNRGGYHGETIAIHDVLATARATAQERGWMTETLPVTPELNLWAFHRGGTAPRRRVYISAGIHGDEPAGPLAVRQMLDEDRWPTGVALWVCPCLNPTGFVASRRENAAGFDLNRDYRHQQTAEIRAHAAWLARQPSFDLTLCLHEDWEAAGFYLYELNPDQHPSAAERAVAAVAALCPIDPAPVIDGREARGGVIRPSLDPENRPQWPEAFYLLRHKTRHSYTLEAPSDFPLARRVAALVTAVRSILDGE